MGGLGGCFEDSMWWGSGGVRGGARGGGGLRKRVLGESLLLGLDSDLIGSSPWPLFVLFFFFFLVRNWEKISQRKKTRVRLFAPTHRKISLSLTYQDSRLRTPPPNPEWRRKGWGDC